MCSQPTAFVVLHVMPRIRRQLLILTVLHPCTLLCTLLARRNKLVSCNLRSVPLDNRTETAKSKEHRFRAVLRAPTLRLTIDGQKRSWPLFSFSVVDTVAHRPADAVCVVGWLQNLATVSMDWTELLFHTTVADSSVGASAALGQIPAGRCCYCL